MQAHHDSAEALKAADAAARESASRGWHAVGSAYAPYGPNGEDTKATDALAMQLDSGDDPSQLETYADDLDDDTIEREPLPR